MWIPRRYIWMRKVMISWVFLGPLCIFLLMSQFWILYPKISKLMIFGKMKAVLLPQKILLLKSSHPNLLSQNKFLDIFGGYTCSLPSHPNHHVTYPQLHLQTNHSCVSLVLILLTETLNILISFLELDKLLSWSIRTRYQ